MLTSLKIERFRGIPSLTLNDLGRVNIFIGENGAGKTTVLEAVYLAAFPTVPYRLLQLGQYRDMPVPSLDSNDAFTTLFFKGDSSSGLRIEFSIDGRPANRLSLNGLKSNGADDLAEYLNDPNANLNLPQMRGIEAVYIPGEGDPDGYKLTLHRSLLPKARSRFFNLTGGQDDGLPVRVSTPPRDEGGIGCYPIPARFANSVENTSSALTWLIENKRSGQFMKMLQAVDPRVIDITPGTRADSPVVLVDVGLPTMLPINTLGDGLCRVALLATGMFAGGAELVMVDEIDSGLHFSAMAGVWRGICELVVQENKQIFCTTHSEEMLASTLDAFSDTPEILRVYRIDRRRTGAVEATSYDYDLFRAAEETPAEIR